MTGADVAWTLVDVLAPLFAVPIATAATGALWKLWSLIDKKATAQDKANLEADLYAALSVGIGQALPLLRLKGWHDPVVRTEVLRIAGDYLKQRFPDRATQIATAAGVATDSLASPTATAAIASTLEGRFVSAVKTTFAVPAPGGAASGPTGQPATTPAANPPA